MTVQTRQRTGAVLTVAFALASVFAFVPWPKAQHENIGSGLIVAAIAVGIIGGRGLANKSS